MVIDYVDAILAPYQPFAQLNAAEGAKNDQSLRISVIFWKIHQKYLRKSVILLCL